MEPWDGIKAVDLDFEYLTILPIFSIALIMSVFLGFIIQVFFVSISYLQLKVIR